MTKPLIARYAIYTRKSSDEGLDREFNSLQAQREACEGCCQSKVNLSPPGAGMAGWSRLQAMTARHSAKAAERLSL